MGDPKNNGEIDWVGGGVNPPALIYRNLRAPQRQPLEILFQTGVSPSGGVDTCLKQNFDRHCRNIRI